MPTTVNGNNNQVTINITDTIPPDNMATIDKNGLVGNTYTKTQFDQSFSAKSEEIDTKIENIQKMIETDFKGTLKPSDPAPTEDGSYKPEISSKDNIGTDPVNYGTVYANAGNLRAKEGYETMFYKKGTTWTKAESKMPEASNKIDTWAAGSYSAGKQVINPVDQSIYEANADVISTDVPGISSKWVKKMGGFIDFKTQLFFQNVDLSRDNETPYTELIGATKFTLNSTPKTGKVAIYKLTGGSVTFDTNFVAAPDSPSYNAAKTNIIYFWYEYGKVRYTIEVQDLETVSYANVVSYYQLNGKTPNTLLSAIAPNYGASLIGNTGGYTINSSGTWAATTSNAGSTSSAIGVNLGSVVNYRVTLHLSVATLAEVNIGATAYDVWTSFIDINFASTTTIKHIYPGSPAGGAVLVSTTSVTFPQLSVYRWDFEVIGNKVKVYFEGKLLTQYTNTNTGNIFALILSKTGDVLQSLKIEEL